MTLLFCLTWQEIVTSWNLVQRSTAVFFASYYKSAYCHILKILQWHNHGCILLSCLLTNCLWFTVRYLHLKWRVFFLTFREINYVWYCIWCSLSHKMQYFSGPFDFLLLYYIIHYLFSVCSNIYISRFVINKYD